MRRVPILLEEYFVVYLEYFLHFYTVSLLSIEFSSFLVDRVLERFYHIHNRVYYSKFDRFYS